MVSAQRTPTHAAPYAADGSAEFYGVNSASGTDPENFGVGLAGNHDFQTSFGYATPIIESTAGTPDPIRLEDIPRTDRRANLRNPFAWWRKFDSDTQVRESATTTQATGFTEAKRRKTRADDPRWVPVDESRPTQLMSPHTYVFTRPFDQTIARRLNGQHLSLAVNRRNYDILTMTPVAQRRNTYRTEPSPWDTDIVDETPDATQGRPDSRLQSPNILPPASSAYRL